jgi:hypothetical protein
VATKDIINNTLIVLCGYSLKALVKIAAVKIEAEKREAKKKAWEDETL